MYFRITPCLLFLSLLFVLRISHSMAQCPDLEKVISIPNSRYSAQLLIHQIEKQSQLRFSYNAQHLKGLPFVVSERTGSIGHLLDVLTASQSLNYECIGKNEILIYRTNPDYVGSCRGFVYDAQSLAPLADVVVYTRGGVSISCDADGYFQIHRLKFPDTLLFVMPGYQMLRWPMDKELSNLEVFMIPDADLSEVLVQGRDSILLAVNKNGWILNAGKLGAFPTFSLTPGVMNTLTLFPGLQSTLEVNGGVVVRGGDFSQNLVLLDGLEVYNPTHAFGMFGIFSAHMLQGVELYKGSFPVKYAGKASSATYMRSKQGDMKKWNGVATLNPLFGSLDVNGPLFKERTSLTLSLRRSLTDLFPLYYEAIQSQNEIDRFRYYFFDTKLNLDHRLKSGGKLYLGMYSGGDIGYINSSISSEASTLQKENNRDNFNQTNQLFQAGWKQWWKGYFASDLSIGITQYRFDLRNKYGLQLENDSQKYERTTDFRYRTQITDYQILISLWRNDRFGGIWNAGNRFILHNFTPNNSVYWVRENNLQTQESEVNTGASRVPENRAYLEYNLRKPKWDAHAGLSYSSFHNREFHHLLQPVVYFRYNWKPSVHWHAGYGQTFQYLHAIVNNNTGLPFNVWIPSDAQIPPVTTEQFETGLSIEMSGDYILQTDFYHRILRQVPGYKFSLIDLLTGGAEQLLSGEGRSSGMECFLMKKSGSLTGWLKYTLSKTERKFDEINDGNWFPFQFDRRHDLALIGAWKLNRQWLLGISAVYSSGHYITIPESQYLVFPGGEPRLIAHFGRMNNLQVPDYFRLDAGLTYEMRSRKYRHVLSLNVYNLTNRENVYYVTASFTESGTTVFEPVSLLPFIPSIHYAIHF